MNFGLAVVFYVGLLKDTRVQQAAHRRWHHPRQGHRGEVRAG
ncbi:hypothetical protein [Micromonospora globbae]|nr:hypothetical protein [Micromonospora globbae]